MSITGSRDQTPRYIFLIISQDIYNTVFPIGSEYTVKLFTVVFHNMGGVCV